jgi:hypothetical protein
MYYVHRRYHKNPLLDSELAENVLWSHARARALSYCNLTLPSFYFLFFFRFLSISLYCFSNKRKGKWAKVLYSKVEHLFQSREPLE